MNITEATIHEIKKDARTHGEGSVSIHTRNHPLNRDITLENTCSDLLRIYAKSINGNGTLGTNSSADVFPINLKKYREGEIDFHNFTLESLKLIAREMESSTLASGGFALFLRYTEGGSDFLLIAMLKLKPGAGINEESLDLEPTLNIDLGLLNEAARINLTRMDDGQEPYLTFVKGSDRRGDVTEYFRRALSCSAYTSSRHHTTQVIMAAEAFVQSRDDLLTQEDKRKEIIDMHERLYECFSSNSDEIVLDTISAAVSPKDPGAFKEFIQPKDGDDGYDIDHAFKPDKATYRKIKRITARMGTVSVGFDVADIYSGRVTYDAQLDALVLRNPTEHIKKVVSDNAASY